MRKSKFNFLVFNQTELSASALIITGIKSQIGNLIYGTSLIFAFESKLPSNINENIHFYVMPQKNIEGGIILHLKVGEDRKSICDCRFAQHAQEFLEEKELKMA